MTRCRLSIITYILSCLIAVFLLSSPAAADIASGTYDSVSWKITDDGELILGNGGTQTMTRRTTRYSTSWPWNSYYNSIKKVSVNGTVYLRGSLYAMFFRDPGGSLSYEQRVGYPNCVSIDLSTADFSGVTNMQFTFLGMPELVSITFPEVINTVNNTSLHETFAGDMKLASMDLSKLDTSKVTSMFAMFFNCRSLADIDVSGWDVSRLVNAQSLFNQCLSVEELDVSHWDTSSITIFDQMFANCQKLQSLDLSNFDTSRCTLMGNMFYRCKSLTYLDLSSFDTTRNVGLYGFLYGCTNLEEVVMPTIDTRDEVNMANFCTNCPNLKTVTIGSNFRFKGNGISQTNRQVIFPTPTGEQYTGNWIREDGTFGPYSPEELRDNYTPAMAGTWVWEEGSPFTVEFTAPDGAAGSMPNIEIYPFRDNAIPANEFVWFNHHFVYWDGSDGSTYTDGEIIPADTFTEGDILTLTAVFEQDNNDASFSGGEADVYLIGGEMIELPNLPGGTGYQIWEETPSGWQLVDQSNPAGVVPANGTAAASFTNEYVPGTATIQLIATKTLDGQIPAAEAYQFELVDQNGEVIETVSNTGTGVVMFSTLTFRLPGEFDYTVREVRGDDPAINYDTHEEHVQITVTDDGAGNLTAIAEYDSDGLAFVNETKPGMLTVAKQTDGSGNPDETFTFLVKITDNFGRSLDSVQVVIP